jgi:hypothetical protein
VPILPDLAPRLPSAQRSELWAGEVLIKGLGRAMLVVIVSSASTLKFLALILPF